ncbi:MAG: hypothetical protein LWW75_08335, partial [Chlorobiales bacterium]|nr:hypothetical protein [Chlorobiales bacterium]
MFIFFEVENGCLVLTQRKTAETSVCGGFYIIAFARPEVPDRELTIQLAGKLMCLLVCQAGSRQDAVDGLSFNDGSCLCVPVVSSISFIDADGILFA